MFSVTGGTRASGLKGGAGGNPNGTKGGDATWTTIGAGGVVPALAGNDCYLDSVHIPSTVGQGGTGGSSLTYQGYGGMIFVAFYE